MQFCHEDASLTNLASFFTTATTTTTTIPKTTTSPRYNISHHLLHHCHAAATTSDFLSPLSHRQCHCDLHFNHQAAAIASNSLLLLMPLSYSLITAAFPTTSTTATLLPPLPASYLHYHIVTATAISASTTKLLLPSLPPL